MSATLHAPVRPPVRAWSGNELIAPLTLAVIGTGAVAVIALWWHDTPIVHGLDGWLTNAGRITGLLAGYAVVVLLALMARMPILERGLGTDRLARWHAAGGRYTVGLAVAHTLLIIWGYSLTTRTGLVSQTTTLLTAYPDVLMATVALGILRRAWASCPRGSPGASSATRRGTSSTCTPTSRSRSRSATSSRPAPTSSTTGPRAGTGPRCTWPSPAC